MDEPLSESELKVMYNEIVSLSREESAGHSDHKVHLRDIIEKLKPVLFEDQGDIHRTILTKVDHEAERDDVVNQALIVSRELGQKHLSLHIFNLLVYIHSLSGRSKQASLVVSTIQDMGINPDEKTFSFLMNAYANDGNLPKTIETFKSIQINGLSPSPNSYGILIKAYAKHKRVEDAFDVYEKMKKLAITPSQPIFGTLIQACIRAGQIERAWKTFDHMRLKVCQADLVSFTLMLSACAKRGEAERAMNLFEEMGEQGIVPSQHAFNAVISACSSRPDYYVTALEILDRMISLHGFQPDIYTLNTLLHAAQTGRRLDDARIFFSKIISLEDGTEQAGVAYTNLFHAYAKQCKPSRKDEGLGATAASTSTALVDSDIYTILSRPSPTLAGDCVAEARLVMQHMERVFSGVSSQQLAWARVSYLLIHTNYCNFDEAMDLYSTYYAQTNPPTPTYT
ncbi:hypothetical protein DSO57_1014430 [Entomophthora muscae]|uniref:Uncharacterized protein n=1 Tax=Entomophthora muscae TaxID=34485 RepID=A0ACC2URS4_9FUNG|nr:hypothetical protein DSO57_1014430 [Entomophthora muscae]